MIVAENDNNPRKGISSRFLLCIIIGIIVRRLRYRFFIHRSRASFNSWVDCTFCSMNALPSFILSFTLLSSSLSITIEVNKNSCGVAYYKVRSPGKLFVFSVTHFPRFLLMLNHVEQQIPSAQETEQG